MRPLTDSDTAFTVPPDTFSISASSRHSRVPRGAMQALPAVPSSRAVAGYLSCQHAPS